MSDIIVSDATRSSLQSLEPAIDPQGRPTFLIDWELTLKCNLDCSYCSTEITHGGHLPGAKHPSKEDCFKTIEFMLEYVDLYMQYKPKWTRAVVLNVYGGESLFHPEIAEILKKVKSIYQKYKDNWPLKITCTTNLIIGKNLRNQIWNLVDEFTVSYHSESVLKQKQMFLDNVLFLKQKNKDTKVILCMHQDPQRWKEILKVKDFCEQHNIRYLCKALDGDLNSNYTTEQIAWFRGYWNKHSSGNQTYETVESDAPLSTLGRTCCGGRQMCSNGNLKQRSFFIQDNNFFDWHCSVNWFFLFIRQHTNEIFVNKDCRMSFNNKVEPIATLDSAKELIEKTKQQLTSGSMPVIQCKKSRCVCGLCAPKALTRSNFDNIMNKHITQDVFEK